MATRTLTIRGIPDSTLERLRARAITSRRSLNSELLVLLERAAGAESAELAAAGPTEPTERAPTRSSALGTRALREPPPPAYVSGTTPLAALVPVDRDALAEVCRRYRIRWLAVFGSLAHGVARADSDADVVVEFEPGATPGFGIVRVADALRPLFGGRRVDLVTRAELGRLQNGVLRTARTLYAAG